MTDYLQRIAAIGTDPETGKRVALKMSDTGDTTPDGSKIMKLVVDTEMGPVILGDVNVVDITKTKVSPTNGEKDVTSAGTAVAIGSGDVSKIMVQAKEGNSGKIFFGSSAVDSSNGIYLTPGEVVVVESNNDEKLDLGEHYIDSEVNGEGVTFCTWS